MKLFLKIFFLTASMFTGLYAHSQPGPLKAGEYFWDGDPGQGKGTPFSAVGGSYNAVLENLLQTGIATPGSGFHTFNVRVEDSSGFWGRVNSLVIDVLGDTTASITRNLISAEYFWDTDPGVGNGTPMLATDGSFNQVVEGIFHSNLTPPSSGFHTFNVRAKNQSGNWGRVHTTVIDVLGDTTATVTRNLIAAEYYWDIDPGVGNGTAMLATDGSFNQVAEGIFHNNLSPPSSGIHTFNVRAKNESGNWGRVHTTVIDVLGDTTATITRNLISAEYYWDIDPGVGNGTAMLATDGSFNQVVEGIFHNNLTPPSSGFHTFNVRAKNESGNWGRVHTTVIDVLGDTTADITRTLLAAEYYWDTDPGVGNGTPMLATDGSFNQVVEGIFQNNVNPPSSGLHTFNVRAKNESGNWGRVHTTVIDVLGSSPPDITRLLLSAEYFWDTDPGAGNGTPMLSATGSFNQVVEAIKGGSIPSPVVAGMHTLYMRAKNESGIWGRTTGIVVDMDTTIGGYEIAISGPLTLCSNHLSGAVYSIPYISGNNYVWTIEGGTFTNGSDSNIVTVTWSPTGPYKLHVTECNAGATLCSSDSISISVNPIATTLLIDSICQGLSLDGYNTSGTYVDTFEAFNGCDSIRTLNLTVKPEEQTTINKTICAGQSYDGYGATGSYADVYTGSNGCDSVRTLNLTVQSVIQTSVSVSICPGQTYDNHNTAGTYTDTFNTVAGCDSIVTLHLAVNSVVRDSIDKAICAGATYDGYGASGTYIDTFTGASGCDSIRALHLTVNSTVRDVVKESICAGQSYDGYSATGNYIDTFTGSNGCDSIRTLELLVNSVVQDTVNISICTGQSYQGYSGTGTYTDVFQGSNGCDSTRVLNLTVQSELQTSVNKTICQGASYDGHSQTGTYVDTFNATGGCDSVRTLNLIVIPNITTSVSENICEGQSYGGHDISGTFVDTLTAAGGCDSIRTLNLTVFPLLRDTVSVRISDGQSYEGHDSSGLYVDTLPNVSGCDTVRLLYLTVTTGINNLTVAETQLDLFPNPAAGSINLSANKEITSYQVYDPWGQLVLKRDNIRTVNDVIDLTGWAKGVYFLQATLGGEKVVKRFAVVE